MQERIPITAEGLAALQAEYEELVNVRRPEIIRIVAQAREEGDLRENAGYHAAKNDQGFIEGRIREIEGMLKRVELIDSAPAHGPAEVRLGSTVTIEIDGDKETYTIVGAVEAKPALGRISNVSPVGKALLGARVGDNVHIQTPASLLQARVIAIE
ncbi:MAG: transcription elongation factor GreA [Chloroflexi bacterium]|nr:MAG: transcription elongation factor GreA [Chloroflexota bacterium]